MSLAIAFSAASLSAQSPIKLDLSYGEGGVSIEGIPEHWRSRGILGWHVYDDGTTVVVRSGPVDDTAGYIAKLLKNGQPDPFYGSSGNVSIGAGITSMQASAFFDQSVYVGGLRAGRYEIMGFDEFGKVNNRLFWQDDEKTTPMYLMGMQPEGDLVFWNKTTNWDDPTFRMRFVPIAPFNDRNVEACVVDPSPMKFDIGSEPQPVGAQLVDGQGRVLMMSTWSDDRVVIIRILEDGTLDETFGNALGRHVIDLPDGAETSWNGMSITQLQRGGYVLAFTTRPENTIDSKSMFLFKLTEDGLPFQGFGVDGSVILHGNQMQNRGVTELPNGDLVVLSFGTYVYSHLYHITTNGLVIPGDYGDFSITPLMSRGVVIQGRWLYGIVGLDERKVARFELSKTVTSVDVDRSTNPEVHLRGSALVVRGLATPATVSIYSVTGEALLTEKFQESSMSNSVSLARLQRGPLFVVIAQEDGRYSRHTVLH